MYYIEQGTELTLNQICDLIQKFNSSVVPKLQRWENYYNGKQDILKKYYADTSKPCTKTITNYCKSILDNYSGYLTGKPVSYNSDEDITKIMEILNYNDVEQEDSDFLKSALCYGIAYEVAYIDADKQIRFTLLDPKEVIPIYYNTLDNELAYVIRYYRTDNISDTENYQVEVYSANSIDQYTTDAVFSSLQPVNSTQNFFNQIPISIFELNKEKVSIFDCIMSLQDAYNELQSDEIDDYSAFIDSYLVIKNLEVEDEELQKLRENRVLKVGADGDVSYLTKNANDTQIENMLKNISDNIHKIANSPDFTEESFGTSSGIALRYKLLGFENNAGAIEKQMKKALQKRIELIASIFKLTDGVEIWRDIEISFKRNLPIDLADLANTLNMLRGIVSTETLLGQLPFIADVQNELDKVAQEKQANMDLYGFENMSADNNE